MDPLHLTDLRQSLESMEPRCESSPAALKEAVVLIRKQASLPLSDNELQKLANMIVYVVQQSNEEELVIEVCENLIHAINLIGKTSKVDLSNVLFGLLNWLRSRPNSKVVAQTCVLKSMKYLLKNTNLDGSIITAEHIFGLMDNLRVKNAAFKVADRTTSDGLMSEAMWSKLVLATVRTLYAFSSELSPSNLDKLLGTILGFLKALTFCGLPGYDIHKQKMAPLYSSPINQYIPEGGQTQAKAKPKGRRKQQRISSDLPDEGGDGTSFLSVADMSGGITTPSDSDTTSAEPFSADVSFLKKTIKQNELKIRILSYECLCCIVRRSDRRSLFGYWSSFIPDSAGIFTTELNVVFSILKDPSPKVRSVAVNFIRELMVSGSHYVSTLAENKGRSSKHPFVTVSQTLAEMVVEVHRGLHSVLFAESNLQVLLQTLKCLSVLVSITPYHKLRDAQLSATLNKVIPLFSGESQVQSAVLALLVSVLSLDNQPEELLSWINSVEGRNHMKFLAKFTIEKSAHLDSISLSTESLKFISTCLKIETARSFFDLAQLMDLAAELASAEIVLNNAVVQSHTCKFLHSLAMFLKTSSCETSEMKIRWWVSLLQSPLFVEANKNNELIQSSSGCTLIDTISCIDKDTFNSFLPKFRFYLLSLLFSKCALEDASVTTCASAIRCLGVFLEQACINDDLSCVMDVCVLCNKLVEALIRENMRQCHHLAYQVSWTFANVQDSILKYHCQSEDLKLDFLPSSFKICKLLFDFEIPSVLGCNVKTNTVRALSGLMQLALQLLHQTPSCEPHAKLLMVDGTKVLLNLLTKWKHFKLHWNIFYAFAILLCNFGYLTLITENFTNFVLCNEIFEVTLTVIENTKNYKVQAYAIHALCCVKRRDFYLKITPQRIYCTIVELLLTNFTLVPESIKSVWLEKVLNALKSLSFLLTKEEFEEFKLDEKRQVLQEFVKNNLDTGTFGNIQNTMFEWLF